MPDFSIQQEAVGDSVVLLKVAGFLDAHTFEQLEESINGLFSQNYFRIIMDLEGVGYISSAGAGVFIAALSEAEESDGKIVLLNPTKGVLDVFDLLGLTAIFTITNNKDEAIAAANA